MAQRKDRCSNSSGANLGFESTLWAAAGNLRNNMDAAEYKHVVPGIIFLTNVSGSSEQRRQRLRLDTADPKSNGTSTAWASSRGPTWLPLPRM